MKTSQMFRKPVFRRSTFSPGGVCWGKPTAKSTSTNKLCAVLLPKSSKMLHFPFPQDFSHMVNFWTQCSCFNIKKLVQRQSVNHVYLLWLLHTLRLRISGSNNNFFSWYLVVKLLKYFTIISFVCNSWNDSELFFRLVKNMSNRNSVLSLLKNCLFLL